MSGAPENDLDMRQFLDTLFPAFVPHSQNYWDYPELTFHAASAFPHQLFTLMAMTGHIKNKDIDLASSYGRSCDTTLLGDLLDKHGSDKHTHGYTPALCKIFESFASKNEFAILEIGLGTNTEGAIGNMGVSGKPGASLRAFRDYLPNAKVYGADLDKAILFSEERIRTTFVDQTNIETFKAMNSELGVDKFDVIIDDGLHSPISNLNTIIFGLESINDGGYIIIEDIFQGPRMKIWQIVRNLLEPEQYEVLFLKAKDAFLFIVHKKAINGRP